MSDDIMMRDMQLREFKFRAWHEANKEMIYFDNAKAKNDQYVSGSIMSIFDNDFKTPMMQYIGVIDLNGENIYEEDFVLISKIGTCQVTWSTQELCWLFIELNTDDEYHYDDIIEEALVIKGNIYEGIK